MCTNEFCETSRHETTSPRAPERLWAPGIRILLRLCHTVVTTVCQHGPTQKGQQALTERGSQEYSHVPSSLSASLLPSSSKGEWRRGVMTVVAETVGRPLPLSDAFSTGLDSHLLCWCSTAARSHV